MTLDGKSPTGPLSEQWDRHRDALQLIAPNNRRKYQILVVGSGLAGASAAATFGELGYQVKCFCYQDSARRAHSIAAQGGINAAKNYQNDGDSIFRLFRDTIKGGDFRSRESSVYRLAQLSLNLIDQSVAQGVPYAREYGGLLANRSFGGVQVSRTFYCRGQTGQQLLLGAYQALCRQVERGQVEMLPHHEMLDLVIVEGRAAGIVVRELRTGEIKTYSGHAVVLATGGYSNVYYLSTNAKGCNTTAIWRAYRRGAYFGNPCFTQIHPTCIPPTGEHQSKLTLMSESLRNDGRIWVPNSEDEQRPPQEIPEEERDYFLERKYPAYGNLVPRDLASRSVKEVCDEGRGVGPSGLGVYLDLGDAIKRLGRDAVADRYGNLFDMYHQITEEDAYQTPMRIYPAPHYTMGGLWVDYNLMSNLPGLFVIGEANFSDHGANRLGASALMQGLADGYFILPATLPDYLAKLETTEKPKRNAEPFQKAQAEVNDRIQRLLSANGKRTVTSLHRELGQICFDGCGMSRSRQGLEETLGKIKALEEEFWTNIRVPGESDQLNESLEKAGRVADFFQLAQLMCHDALNREESCGAHYRIEHSTEKGEIVRDDENYAYVAGWEFQGDSETPKLHQEPLEFNFVEVTKRSYE